ncbi:MAG: hypothetical protein SVR04_00860 [Spirochaetota bacterium]|nr:hypothetical protein [Spirochaetota bacterium]
MTELKHVTFLIGSTRGIKTTSESMVNYMSGLFEKKDVSSSAFRVPRVCRNAGTYEDLESSLLKGQLFFIAAPLYLDTPPAAVLELCERLYLENPSSLDGRRCAAIIHSGYPERIQRDAALRIIRSFALQAGMKWDGGIGFGGTSPIDGTPLEEAGIFSATIRACMSRMVESLLRNKPFSRELINRSGRFLFPKLMLPPILNRMMKSQAGKYGVRDIFAAPYNVNTGE